MGAVRERAPFLLRALAFLAALFLLAFAYAPILRAGFLGEDYGTLFALPETLGQAFGEARPLGVVSLVLSRALYGLGERAEIGSSAAAWLRAENLVLLLLAASGLVLFVRRLTLPWCGSEHAKHASLAAGLLFVLHPLTYAAVAALSARGELLGLACATFAGAAFLRGRQERRDGWTIASVVLATLGGLATDLSIGLAFALAAAEFLSARRYRLMGPRLRTSLSTLCVFAVAALVGLLQAWRREGSEALPESLFALTRAYSSGELGTLARHLIEKLGLLFLPANVRTAGLLGTAAAGALFLAALQPGFAAARSAPRLWSSILLLWALALLGSAAWHAEARVAPDDLSRALVLLSSTAIVSAGLGLFATALSGKRRALLPWIVAAGYAGLSHANSRPWREAAASVEQLVSDVHDARELHGRELPLLIVDAPREVLGVRALGDDLSFLAETARSPSESRAPVSIASVRSDVLTWTLREPAGRARLADAHTLVLAPAVCFDGGAENHGARRVARVLGPVVAGSSPRSWKGNLSSPPLDLPVADFDALVVTLPPGVAPRGLDLLSVFGEGRGEREGRVLGVWIEKAGRWIGTFDLASSLAWALAGRARLLVFEEGLQEPEESSLEPSLPSLTAPLAPRVKGEDWEIELPPPHVGVYVLVLVDPAALEGMEIELVPLAAGGFRARGAAAFARDRAESCAALELRVEGRALARVPLSAVAR